MSKEMFENAELQDELPKEEKEEEPETVEELEDWTPSVSDESVKAKLERKGLKEIANGKTLTIKEISFTKPKTKSFEGEEIAPKKAEGSNVLYYTGKLVIKFVEDNLIEYYPNVKYFVNAGVINKSLKMPRQGKSQVADIVAKTLKLIKRPSDEVSDKAIITFLIGKKVEIETEEGVWKNKKWFRNNISKILPK